MFYNIDPLPHQLHSNRVSSAVIDPTAIEEAKKYSNKPYNLFASAQLLLFFFSRPLFVYFRSFHMTNIANILQMKKHRWRAWELNPGGKMVGADESTELWRHPTLLLFFHADVFYHFPIVSN